MLAKRLLKLSKELLFFLVLLTLLIAPVVRGNSHGGGGGRFGGRLLGDERKIGLRTSSSSSYRPWSMSSIPRFPFVPSSSYKNAPSPDSSSSTRLNLYYYNNPLLFLLRGTCSLLCDHISFTIIRSYIGFALAMAMLLLFLLHFWDNGDHIGPSYNSTLLMVQVGKATSVKKEIFKTSYKSCVEGFHRLLTETMTVLRQHHDYWNTACSHEIWDRSLKTRRTIVNFCWESLCRLGIQLPVLEKLVASSQRPILVVEPLKGIQEAAKSWRALSDEVDTMRKVLASKEEELHSKYNEEGKASIEIPCSLRQLFDEVEHMRRLVASKEEELQNTVEVFYEKEHRRNDFDSLTWCSLE
ncbi:hypothetical protein TorRG33x02_019780 [Trema orientale]|uniref:Transmembrane protein n=1 Tax=Trema orientale TaxID=63057 RepID=A0A2P5FWN4_TREOI|nr:hypothetical protein TorRG33x02_019780 [Trema orientale]